MQAYVVCSQSANVNQLEQSCPLFHFSAHPFAILNIGFSNTRSEIFARAFVILPIATSGFEYMVPTGRRSGSSLDTLAFTFNGFVTQTDYG
jgi:hypothetical protein